jgi:hypothetical protein
MQFSIVIEAVFNQAMQADFKFGIRRNSAVCMIFPIFSSFSMGFLPYRNMIVVSSVAGVPIAISIIPVNKN